MQFRVLCLILHLFYYATEIETSKKKVMNPKGNLKKLPDRIFLPEKPVNASRHVKKNATGGAAPPIKRWKYKDYIRACGEDTESMEHLLCYCDVLATKRMNLLGNGYPIPEDYRHFPLSGIAALMQHIFEKFDAATIYEKTERRFKRLGINASREDIYEEVMRGIDPTDELLRFRAEKGDWRVLFGPQYRKTFLPPGTFLARDRYKRPNDYYPRKDSHDKDPWSVRPRLFELMKMIIYQSRDKMTYMQKLREEHNHSAVFKMGFLFAKTDQALKDYHSVAYKSHYLCSGIRSLAYKTMDIMEVITAYERAVMHWFEAELLWDLINRNDRICKDIIEKHHTERKEAFNKVFVD